MLSEQPCREPIQFHGVWVGPLRRTMRLALLSVIYSHPPGCAELNLWTIDDQTRDSATEALRPYLPKEQFHIRTVDTVSLLRDIQTTYPEMKPLLEEKRELFSDLRRDYGGLRLPAYSDTVRWLLLAAYGGVYIDADVLLMRSFRPLLSRDFWYRWGALTTCNTAVLHMEKGSRNTYKFLTDALRSSSAFRDLMHRLHPHAVHDMNLNLNGTVEQLPTIYFDPSWTLSELRSPALRWTVATYGMAHFKRFFRGQIVIKSPDEFSPGSFAHHWHNQWESNLVEGSVPLFFERYFFDLATKRELVLVHHDLTLFGGGGVSSADEVSESGGWGFRVNWILLKKGVFYCHQVLLFRHGWDETERNKVVRL